MTSSRIAMFASLALGCTTGAPAHEIVDGCTTVDAATNHVIPECSVLGRTVSPGDPPQASGWRVVAHGVVEYTTGVEVPSAETPIVVAAVLTSVDPASSSLRLTAADGTIDVTIMPVARGWLEALPLGESVVAHFENGVEIRRAADDVLLLAVVARVGRGPAPSFDVGPIQVGPGPDACVRVHFDGSLCWSGSVDTDTSLLLGSTGLGVSASDVGATIAIRDFGRAYEVIVVGTSRQADDGEVMPHVPHGVACAPALSSVTVVAVGLAPDALLPCAPRAGRLMPTPGSPPTFPGWHVTASGALSYLATDATAMTVDATLAAVGTSSIDLTTPSGTIHVALDPIEPAWLARLPLGHAVRARFEHGLVLREASDDAVLVALVEGVGNVSAPSLDVGPIHVGESRARCIAITNGVTGCGAIGGTAVDATFTLGASSVSLRAGAPAAALRDATHAFEVALLGSLRLSTPDERRLVGLFSSCGVPLDTGTVVAIGLSAP